MWFFISCRFLHIFVSLEVAAWNTNWLITLVSKCLKWADPMYKRLQPVIWTRLLRSRQVVQSSVAKTETKCFIFWVIKPYLTGKNMGKKQYWYTASRNHKNTAEHEDDHTYCLIAIECNCAIFIFQGWSEVCIRLMIKQVFIRMQINPSPFCWNWSRMHRIRS